MYSYDVFVVVSKFLKESDSAEEAPYFEQTLYRAEVREDEEIHHPIITVAAENHDEGKGISNIFKKIK